MVQHKSLWLTNIHYLNDSEEYYYAFDLVKRILDEEYSGLVSMADLPRDRTSTVFSFSLSEESDLLSQWRGYCPNGGFSISFDRLEFNKVIQQEGLRVAKCIYNETEQREYIIKNVIGFAPSEYQAAKDHEKETFVRIPHEMFSLSKKIIKRISDIAPILKHSSFSQEKEWRIFKEVETASESKSLGESTRYYIPSCTRVTMSWLSEHYRY